MTETYAAAGLALPIADRRRSHDFYVAALGLEAVGPIASDGLPEPLMFVVNDGLRLVLIPEAGFTGVLGRELPGDGASEVLIRVQLASEDAVRALTDRAVAAGASLVSEAQRQAWGFESLFADPDGHVWVAAVE